MNEAPHADFWKRISEEIFAPAVGLQDANYSNRLYLRNQRLRAVATTEMAMAMMKP